MAMVLRREFARAGAERAGRLRPLAPPDVVSLANEPYSASPDALMDIYWPSSEDTTDRPLPLVVWVHGGAFVGGSKDEIDYFLKIIAQAGFAVVALQYSLAPEATYPMPVQQVMAALLYLRTNAARLRIDTKRVLLAGDSAGAQISAQVAAVITNPEYAQEMGISPTTEPDELRGLALCSGIFDLQSINPRGRFEGLLSCVGWAYSGTRDYQQDASFISTMSVAQHITAAFPPTFITAGNADPLEPQSRSFAQVLASNGVTVETLFFQPYQQPPLSHEYQFDLSLDRGRAALGRLIAFFERSTNSVLAPPSEIGAVAL